MMVDQYLIVRAASVYLAAAGTAAIWAWRRPDRRALNGALLGFCWNLPALLAVNIAAPIAGWWSYDATGGLLLGMPVDLYLAWAWIWGFAAPIAFRSGPIAVAAAAAYAIDVLLMPSAAPVVRLGSTWLIGETIAIAFVFVPGLLLARWTTQGERLAPRVALQMVTFGGLVLFVLPAVIIEASGGAWLNPLGWPAWRWSLAVQLLAVPAVIGLAAVREFAERGGGTPVPVDPPSRLVTSGIYAYVRNPMQVSGVLLLTVWGALLGNLWVMAGGVMAHVYSIGLAGWDEDGDLHDRFGDRWIEYRRAVRRWIPSWRPWHQSDAPPAQLYVAGSCGMCSQVGEWFHARGARGLAIVAAESHPHRALRRITYESADGRRSAAGVEAIACALQHVHFGWAMVGFALQCPAVRPIAQLIVDASGGQPRPIGTSIRT
jgi:protein-S-isoprenylcysteine O-methyltransferase Ste14